MHNLKWSLKICYKNGDVFIRFLGKVIRNWENKNCKNENFQALLPCKTNRYYLVKQTVQ